MPVVRRSVPDVPLGRHGLSGTSVCSDPFTPSFVVYPQVGEDRQRRCAARARALSTSPRPASSLGCGMPQQSELVQVLLEQTGLEVVLLDALQAGHQVQQRRPGTGGDIDRPQKIVVRPVGVRGRPIASSCAEGVALVSPRTTREGSNGG